MQSPPRKPLPPFRCHSCIIFIVNMRLLLILCCAAFAFASCKSSAPVSPEVPASVDTTTIGSLYPLAYGDYWKFEIDGYAENGATNYSDFETLEITDTLNFRGHKAFFVDQGGPNTQCLLYYSD